MSPGCDCINAVSIIAVIMGELGNRFHPAELQEWLAKAHDTDLDGILNLPADQDKIGSLLSQGLTGNMKAARAFAETFNGNVTIDIEYLLAAGSSRSSRMTHLAL